MKYMLPMASTMTLLSWGVIEFWEGYKDSKELSNTLSIIKWGADFIMKAHTKRNELYGQVS